MEASHKGRGGGAAAGGGATRGRAHSGRFPRTVAGALRQDGAALARMVEEPGVKELPAAAVLILARDLGSAKEWAVAERLLRLSQERYPDNFWLNHNLGMALVDQKPSRLDVAAR